MQGSCARQGRCARGGVHVAASQFDRLAISCYVLAKVGVAFDVWLDLAISRCKNASKVCYELIEGRTKTLASPLRQQIRREVTMSTPELSYSRKVLLMILRLHPTPYAYVRTEAPRSSRSRCRLLGTSAGCADASHRCSIMC